MANKTIPDLNEIDLGDVTTDQLMVLDSGSETFKVRMSTLVNFFTGTINKAVDVVIAGTETGDITVDVSAYVADAQLIQWLFKKPLGGSTLGEQLPGTTIKTPDASTVVINIGDFTIDAGTYVLLGV